MEKIIYLDYQSTTPCDPLVVEKMMPYFEKEFGNPHSKNHAFGWHAEDAIEEARERIATLIGADAKDIIFTSGATESNNIALQGVAHFYKSPTKNHIITLKTEHKCIIDTCRYLKEEGFDITFLPVQNNGLVDLDALKNAMTEKTILVSIMAVNNEIGVIQPLKEIGALCREKGVFFHTDAAQAFGKIPLNVDDMNIDLLSISGHKIYGPKGIGALYIRRTPRVRLKSLFHGGGQERGIRSGTVPTPLCVGLGEAAKVAAQRMTKDLEHITRLYNKMLLGITSQLEEVYLNGDSKHRYFGNLNLSFSCVEGEGLMMGIKNLAVSSGSACTSSSLEPSYVLEALGITEELAHTSIRFGIGRFTTDAEIDEAIASVVKAVNKLRDLSPLWEMKKEGIDIASIQWAAH
ncbi:MAG: IscS subfamily cysteine desulfurase [Proteobacteria bacterium]|nr:IscS subfamily cysteine desulfurase [Pseudomonadota bacterium]